MVPDQFVQGKARKKRHHKERLLLFFVFRNAEIVEINDVRVSQLSENGTFPPKQINLLRTHEFLDRLDGYVALHFEIKGAVNNSHPAFPDDLFDFVSAVEFGGD